jgi:hypothetical protein
LLYAGIGFEGILARIRQQINYRVAYAIGLVTALGILLIYAVRTSDVVASEGYLTDGPYTTSAQQLFQFVRRETSVDSVFIFFKPRALSLYTNRVSSTFPFREPYSDAVEYLNEIGADYVVVKNDEAPPNIVLASFIVAHAVSYELVFENDDFQVYRILQTS